MLAGAIAYNALLSLVPLVILLLVALSQVVSEAQLLEVLHRYLEQLMPSKSDLILRQVQQFLEHRRVLGWTMAGTLLVFSAAAFGVLQNAMKVIFAHRDKVHARGMVTALLLPYLYVLLVGFGLLTITLLNGVLQTWATSDIRLFSWEWSPNKMIVNIFYVIGPLSQIAGTDADLHADAGGPIAVATCPDRRHCRVFAVGRDALRAGVVFRQPVLGQRDLWFAGRRHYRLDDLVRDQSHHPAGCAGHRRVRAAVARIQRDGGSTERAFCQLKPWMMG